MAGITTNMATSFKQELLYGGHNFGAPVVTTGTAASASTSMTSIGTLAGVTVGMPITGTGVGTGAVVATIVSGTAITMSVASTAIITAGAVTFTGDVFKMALIKQGMAGTYGTASVNYTDITGNVDEVTNAAGTSYTATGQALTNVSPAVGGTTAYISFSPNPQWTTATFSTAGCMIYNSSVREGGTSGTNATGGGRCAAVYDFGGSQQVTAGTFSVLIPSASSTLAVLRIA